MGKVLRVVKNDLFEININNVDSSVAMMDRFEGHRPPNIRYKCMLIKQALILQLGAHKYSISLYIVRDKPDDYPIQITENIPKITFSELRESSKQVVVLQDTDPEQFATYSILYSIMKTIKYYSRQHSIDANKEMIIQYPLLFCAQNSDNLRGYGDEWRFGYCISEGTKYGETTNYYVTKISVERV